MHVLAALKTLRSTVRSTMAVKPDFVTTHSTLTAAEVDLKKTLGQPMDVNISLNRSVTICAAMSLLLPCFLGLLTCHGIRSSTAPAAMSCVLCMIYGEASQLMRILCCRVEPVRPTSINPRADYLQWGDYSSRTCRTAPTNWYSDHPAAERA